MKITINAGENLESVIKTLSEFLIEHYSDYPITKNKTSVYLTLKNSVGQLCPDNEKEFIIGDNGAVTDVYQEEKEAALKDVMCKWHGYYESYQGIIRSIERKVQTDINYLETAQEQNRKQENIDNRKKQYEEHLKELEKEKKYLQRLERLNELVENRKITILFNKYMGRSPYNYRLEVALVFDRTEDFKGYFDQYGLHSGLPKEN